MKKLMFVMLSLLSCGAAYALPVGNPADPNLLCDGIFFAEEEYYDSPDCWNVGSIRLGYQGDFIFNHNLQIDDSSDSNIENAELYTNSGLLAVNFFDRVDLYTTFGVSNGYIETNAAQFGLANGSRLAFETESDFSWTVGFKATLIEYGCTTIGLDAKYFKTKPDIKRITLADTVSTYPDDTMDVKIRQYHVALGIAHRINMVVPYAAVKLTHTKYDFNEAVTPIDGSFVTFHDLTNRRKFGVAIGASLIDCEKVSLNIEGRFIDENAVSVNAQFRF